MWLLGTESKLRFGLGLGCFEQLSRLLGLFVWDFLMFACVTVYQRIEEFSTEHG